MPRKSTIRLKRTICDRSYTKQRRGRQTHPHAWGLFVGVLLTGCQTQSAVSTQTVDATYPSYEEIHLVRADALGTCRQGIAYQPDFGAVKWREYRADDIGVHYCIRAKTLDRIKTLLGDVNPGKAEE